MLIYNSVSMQRDYSRPFKSFGNTPEPRPTGFYTNQHAMTLPAYMQQSVIDHGSSHEMLNMHLPRNLSSNHQSAVMQKPMVNSISSETLSHPSTTSHHQMEPNDNSHDQNETGSPVSSSSRQESDQEGFKMPPKKRVQQVPTDQKDSQYWDKRRKNNESAKRSRDARRMKEEQIAMRVVFLDQENLQLRTEVAMLRGEIEKLRCLLYNS